MLQVKSRAKASSNEERERNWLDRNIAKASRQAEGTVLALRRQSALLTNGRGRQIEVDGKDLEWLAVVILDHDSIPSDYMPASASGKVPAAVVTRRDWEFLFDHLRSTHSVVDYLARAAGEMIVLGSEPVRYYEYALADLQAQPDPMPWSLAADQTAIHSFPKAPLEPAGLEDTRAHQLLRVIIEDIATSPSDLTREHDRLLVLSQLDQVPVSSRTELGRTLFTFMDRINGWNGEGSRTDSRIIIPRNPHQAALIFMVGSEFSELTESALLSRIQVLHFDFMQATGNRDAMTIGVLLTPGRSRRRPWDTSMKAVVGDQGYSEVDIAQLKELFLLSSAQG